MSWERHLRELVVAGGALVVGGCSSDPTGSVPCGNANPDPCICGRPQSEADKAACEPEWSCEADGGTWISYDETLPDGGSRPPHCIPPYSGSDGSTGGVTDAPSVDDADGSSSG